MEVLIPITLFMVLGGVLILRPITKRMGLLLEVMAEERRMAVRGRGNEEHFARMTDLLERLNARLEALEDRVHFVERLGEGPRRERLPHTRERHLSGVE